MYQDQKELVSIIVPIYNVEVYLEHCLTSLAKQRYSNLEIIMVDDGSTDDSNSICKRFSKIDSRFILIEQKNAGLGSARNAGMKRATGNYICFVDSDDYVHPDYVRVLYENLIKYQADISMCSYYKFQNEMDDGYINQVNTAESNVNVEVLDRLDLIKDISTTGALNKSERIVVAWNKLMRRDWLGDFQFINKLHEDEFMINDLIPKCEIAVFTDAKLYFYRQRDTSIMSGIRVKNIRHLEVLAAYEKRLKIFHAKEYKSIYQRLVQSFVDNCIILYHMLDSNENRPYLRRIIYTRLLIQCIRNIRYLSLRKIKEIMIFICSPTRHKRKYWS